MKQTKKKTTWQQYMGFAFMMLIGVICGVIMVWYIDKIPDGTPLYQELFILLGLFLGMYVSLFFHIIAHEAGHLIFGLLTGYRFSSFRIASFMWMKESRKLRLKRHSVAGTGGQCLMAPPDMKDGKIPFALYNLGGSMINAILGTLFGVGYLLFSDIPFLAPMLLMLAVIGWIIAMMNGIPMRMGTVDNDGYNTFALSKSKEAIEAFWVQLKMVEQSAKGLRLKDMPAEWFTVPTDESMKNSLVAVRGVFACNRLMDEERFEEADRLMAHLLAIDSGIVGLHRDLLMCDRIYIELIGENRSEVIEDMMTKEQRNFMRAMRRFPSVLRTQYALALLWENNAEKAEMIKCEFEKVAKSAPSPHEVDSERDLIGLADEKAAKEC